MPNITIDGKAIEVPAGTTVIQAAEKLGIFIPRYCYHPGLSVAGNCRICLVDVEKAPKLQIACNTPVAEGMVVTTTSKKVSDGQQSVLEFLLANHPLDCPVCDQSGECDLQNFYMQYGRYDPRFEEQKVKKPKAVPIGPTVMLDAERCILCSRCVRFTDEVTKTGEFGIFNRGEKSEIGLYPGKTLDNDYSGNVVDICPVGALTDRDFRFKARVWYLSTTPSVCNGCSQGCNIDVHYVLDRPHLADGARVMRLKPRYNADVNQWWICDEGRYGFKSADQNRIEKISLKGADSTWDIALAQITTAVTKLKAANQLSAMAVIPSAQLTIEDLYAVKKLTEQLPGVVCTAQVPPLPGKSDDLLMKADKNPNSAGVKLLELDKTPAASIVDAAVSGQIKVLWVIGHDLVKLFGEEKVKQLAQKVELFIYQGPNTNKTSSYAHLVLPASHYLEKDGTFVNVQGRIQRIGKVLPALGDSKADWQIVAALAAKLGLTAGWKSLPELFVAAAAEIKPLNGLTYEKISQQGFTV